MHGGVSRRFQAVPGGSRGVQGPPGGFRGLQGAPGASGRLEACARGSRGGFSWDLNALRLHASANYRAMENGTQHRMDMGMETGLT